MCSGEKYRINTENDSIQPADLLLTYDQKLDGDQKVERAIRTGVTR